MAIEATKANGTAPLQEPTLAKLLSLSLITFALILIGSAAVLV